MNVGRWRLALVGLTVVLVTVTGIDLAGQQLDGAVAKAGALPDPPAGMRWVGTGAVMVAVPEGWTTGETTCLLPVADTVYVDTGAMADCATSADPDDVQHASTLAILVGAYAESQVATMMPLTEIDGREVLEKPGCERRIATMCRHLLAVPDEDVVLAITIADPADGDYRQIRDSLRILPDGHESVPLGYGMGLPGTPAPGADGTFADLVVATLGRAGFRAVRSVVPRGPDAPAGTLVGIQPEPGSVVPERTTVTVTVAEGSLS